MQHDHVFFVDRLSGRSFFYGGTMTQKELLTQRLLLYLKAERDITNNGQTVEIEGMRITRPNIDAVRAEIRNLKGEIAALDAKERAKGRSRIRTVVPLN